jgi:uncharacterized protein (TIRG00374 family)
VVFLKQERGVVANEDLEEAVARDPDAPATETEWDSAEAPDIEPIHKRRSFRRALQLIALIAVVYFFVLPTIPGFRKAATQLSDVKPQWLLLGLGLQIVALICYSMLTRAALGEAGRQVSTPRMFRIQMSTKALSNVVPGGSAAGSALGYRLLTLSGVSGPQAGFALATAGLVSAVVLNLIFWLALVVSIPRRGVNPLYTTAALVGVVIMVLAAAVVVGLLQGQARAEAVLRWVARKFHVDEDRLAAALREIGAQLEGLLKDRQLLKRVAFWATLNWLFDAASLWVFIRAFGATLDVDGLLVAFGLANVVSVIPVTPGGLGIVEGVYIPTLVGFDVPRAAATLGVASYRIAQYFFPTLLGGLLYLSLRVGPFRIERDEELQPLRDIARDEDETRETKIDMYLRARREAEGRGLAEPAPAVAGGRPVPPAASPLGEGSWAADDDEYDDDDEFPHNPS